MLHGGNAQCTVGMRGTGWECAVQGGNARYTVGMRGIGWECVV